jgi:hypothetical protein
MMPKSKPRGPWLRIVEQEERPWGSLEDSPELAQTKKAPDTFEPEERKSFFSGFPLATTILGIMVALLGLMVILLKSDVSVVKSDITGLKNLKDQVAALDPEVQIAGIADKLAEIKGERESMKGEIAQIRTEVETIRAEGKKKKNKPQSKSKDHPPSTNNATREIKKVESLLRKTPPQDISSSHVSRAMSLDPPTK